MKKMEIGIQKLVDNRNETMNKILIILLFTICPYISKGQIVKLSPEYGSQPAKLSKKTLKDTSNLECIYHYTITDKEQMRIKEYDAILEVGDSISKYESYNEYRLDSAVNTINNITNEEYTKLFAKYYSSFKYSILSDNKIMTYYGRIQFDNYTYKETVPVIDWQLTDSVKEICGYVCHQANCDFRGRKWTAWYCDIPKSLGPWKLCGLPGLILEAESADKQHKFTAIQIRKSHAPIFTKENNYFKTTREKYNKSLAEYMNNPGAALKNSPLAPKDINGKPMKTTKRRLFYNPLEKE